MFIEVLYSNLSRERLPINQANNLTKVGVLAMIISCPTTDNPRVFYDDIGYKRLDQSHLFDFYYLLRYWDDNDWWYGLEGRDYGDRIAFHKNSEFPFNASSLREENPRYNYWSLAFQGQQIPNEDWPAAIEVFGEMH
jgi:hypothetical protein